MEDLHDALNLVDILAPIVKVSQSARRLTSVSEVIYLFLLYCSVRVVQLEADWTVNHAVGRSSPS